MDPKRADDAEDGSNLIRLGWGCTPWDAMSRDELVRDAQRMYLAVVAARSVLSMQRRDQREGFWGINGSGHRALVMADRIIEEIEGTYDGDDLYRRFFRYAEDLLFEDIPGLGFGWMVGDNCDDMIGNGGEGEEGEPCPICYAKTGSRLRKLTWSDLKPRPSDETLEE